MKAVWLATLFAKLLVAALWPVTGDEAYFVQWARFPDVGYYDHPPLYSWLLVPFFWVSDSLWWLRLPTILVTSGVGWGIYRLLHHSSPSTAAIAALLYLVSPMNLLGFPMTTDAPLILLVFLSATVFFKAQADDHPAKYFLSGVLLGLAFLAKYLAVLLGAAYVVYLLLFVHRGWRPWTGLLLLGLGALPALALNLYWNYNHCWVNILFNFVNRTGIDGFDASKPLRFLAFAAYLISPWFIYYFIYQHRRFREITADKQTLGALTFFVVPMALFFVLSLRHPLQIHWLLGFVPFLYLFMPAILQATQLRRSLWFAVPFGLLHIVAILVLVSLGTDWYKGWPEHHRHIVFDTYADRIIALARRGEGKHVLATDFYSWSANAAWRTRESVIVFGPGDIYGRQDDILTDFRKLDGRNILIIHSGAARPADLAPYFDKVKQKRIVYGGATYTVTYGEVFHYPVYRQKVLTTIRDRYYRIPSVLPVGACYFTDRYFTTGKPVP